MTRRWHRRQVLAGLGALGASAYLPLGCFRGESGDDRPLDRVVAEESFAVCVIGSGPAGAFLARDLAREGISTLLLESGGGGQASGLDVYRSEGDLEYPLAASRLRAPGGTSGVWTGRCTRLHPVDFEANAYTPEGAGWPLAYAAFEPYYERAEVSLGVRCEPTSLWAPPRRRPFPATSGNTLEGLRGLLGAADVAVDDTPSSIADDVGGPVRVARDLLPAVERLAMLRVVYGATVTRLEADASGHVDAAEVRGPDGVPVRVRAAAFVIACGAVESARLLLLSRSPDHPRGIGNRWGQVGRGFNEHPSFHFYGRIRHDAATLSPAYELGRCHQFYESMKAEGFGSVLLGVIQSWVFPDDVRELKDGGIVGPIVELAQRLRRAELLLDVQMEMAVDPDNRVVLDAAQRDRFGNPGARLHFRFGERDRATKRRADRLVRDVFARLGAEDVRETDRVWGHHHIGTCRMGADPRRSVVDGELRVHGSDNLFVVGSATFPTGGASHPTLTIVAQAHRLADHLVRRLAAKGRLRRAVRVGQASVAAPAHASATRVLAEEA